MNNVLWTEYEKWGGGGREKDSRCTGRKKKRMNRSFSLSNKIEQNRNIIVDIMTEM